VGRLMILRFRIYELFNAGISFRVVNYILVFNNHLDRLAYGAAIREGLTMLERTTNQFLKACPSTSRLHNPYSRVISERSNCELFDF
jgi:hypothetical protein